MKKPLNGKKSAFSSFFDPIETSLITHHDTLMKKNMNPRRKALFWLIFFVAFSIIPLALLEGMARAYIHFKYGVPGKTYGIWKYDKELGAIPRENAYNTNTQTNNYAFRNSEDVLEPKPSGAYRILAYGGSTTFCYNLTEQEAWPYQLELLLRKNHHPKDQVMNGGVITWSLGHAYYKAKKDVPALKPDYVLIYSGLNEYTNDFFLKLQDRPLKDLLANGQHGAVATNLDQCGWAKRNLVLTRILEYVVAPLLEQQASKVRQEVGEEKVQENQDVLKSEPDEYTLQNYLLVLDDFFDLIESNGGEPIFIIETHGRNNKANVYYTSFSRRGAELARQRGITVVDADEVVKQYPGEPMDLFISSGAHFTAPGARLMAGHVFQQVFAAQDTLQQRQDAPLSDR